MESSSTKQREREEREREVSFGISVIPEVGSLGLNRDLARFAERGGLEFYVARFMDTFALSSGRCSPRPGRYAFSRTWRACR